jgi:hypothetical protein
MSKDTITVNGGAMPSARLTLNNLIDEATGRTNRDVLRHLVHRRAMADYGAITPRSIRSSQRYYATLLAQMLSGWRIRHGVPMRMVTVTQFGNQGDGVRRSAF